ncbi:MAG: TorF family putative porin [Oceanococcus sp.]
MKKVLGVATGLVLTAGSLMSAPAVAEVSGNIGVASQYVFRGLVFGDPQVSGGVDWSGGGFYAGTWISSAAGEQEVDFYGGWANDLLDVGYIYYWFPDGNDSGGTVNYGSEVYAGIASGPFSAKAWYAPAGFTGVDDDEYVYVEAALELGLSEKASLTFHVGATEGLGDAVKDADAVIDYSVTLGMGDMFLMVSDTDMEVSPGVDDDPTITIGYGWSFDDVM